VNKGVNEVNSW